MSMHNLNVVFRNYNDAAKPLSQRPVAWCFLLLYGVLAAGTAALAASFLIGTSVPKTPVASVGGASCGYLYEGCSAVVTPKPTVKPTAFPTEPPVPTRGPTVPTARPTKAFCESDLDCFETSAPYCLFDLARGVTNCAATNCDGAATNGGFAKFYNPCRFFDSVAGQCKSLDGSQSSGTNVCRIASNQNTGRCFVFPIENPAQTGKCCSDAFGCVPA
jgi:hypothetical protein